MVIYPLKLGELAAALDFLSTFIHRLCTLTGQTQTLISFISYPYPHIIPRLCTVSGQTQTLHILHIISISSYYQIVMDDSLSCCISTFHHHTAEFVQNISGGLTGLSSTFVEFYTTFQHLFPAPFVEFFMTFEDLLVP